MRILFIGGTRFVGLAMARAALARGHEVHLFHRTATAPAALEGASHLQGDRSGDLSALRQGQWDAVIDACAYRPRDVETMTRALAGRVGKYLLVSSVSVYAEHIPPNADESAALADTSALDRGQLATIPVNGETYGPLKVLCEEALRAAGVGHLILRPTYVIGPGDYTDRFPEWVRRIAAGGEVEAPGPREATVQYIDARDLGEFAISALEQGLSGAMNVAATTVPFSFGELLAGIAEGVAPAGTRLHWLTAEEAKNSHREFPLWHGGESLGVAAVNCDAARSAGLRCRPLAQTARDVLAWLGERDARRTA